MTNSFDYKNYNYTIFQEEASMEQSEEEFKKTRLDGAWDESRAGQRMKLATAITWETELSAKGNNAEAWEGLINARKLPYMAALRNLRNIFLASVR